MTVKIVLTPNANDSKITHVETGQDLIEIIQPTAIHAEAGETTKVTCDLCMSEVEIEPGTLSLCLPSFGIGEAWDGKTVKSIEFDDGTTVYIDQLVESWMEAKSE